MNGVITRRSKSNQDLKTTEDSDFSLYLPFSRPSKAEYFIIHPFKAKVFSKRMPTVCSKGSEKILKIWKPAPLSCEIVREEALAL